MTAPSNGTWATCVMHQICGAPQFLRRARGFAPLPVAVPHSDRVVLALGGHQKNTIALAVQDRVFISQHIGDLDSLETRKACERVVCDFLELYSVKPDIVAHDLHPDYASSQLAESLTTGDGWLAGVPRLAVQHHHAHLAACLVDAGHEERALGVIATRFHAALVAAVLEVAERAGVDCVALSGGCFQNRVLTEACVSALQKKKLKAVTHCRLPPNDGGLCLGQALVARAVLSSIE